MRRLCKLVRSLSGSGDRRRSKSSREYPLSLSRHERNAVFLLPHGSTFIVSLGWVKIWTGLTLTFFKGIPHTDSFTPYVRLSCHLSSIRAVMLILDRPPFPGDFFTPAFQCPHRVERVGTLGDGGKWVCGLDRVAKQKHCVIYSFGLFLLLYPLHASGMVDRIAYMLTPLLI